MGNDYFSVNLGLNKKVPFSYYNEETGEAKTKQYDVNIVAYHHKDKSTKETNIIVEKNNLYGIFYYNGFEKCFKSHGDLRIVDWKYDYDNDDIEKILNNVKDWDSANVLYKDLCGVK